jgi:26S proteasome regulatory subunit N12
MVAAACHFAGDVLEFAVLSSVKHKDDAGFERNFNQLRTYYTDTRRASRCGLHCSEKSDDAGVGTSSWRLHRNPSAMTPGLVCCRSLLPPSEAELLVTGLNLLRLLVQNRIAEFHTELELLPQQVCPSHFLGCILDFSFKNCCLWQPSAPDAGTSRPPYFLSIESCP